MASTVNPKPSIIGSWVLPPDVLASRIVRAGLFPNTRRKLAAGRFGYAHCFRFNSNIYQGHRRPRIGLRRLRDHRAPAPLGSVTLARYFLHLRDGSDELLDPDGSEYASHEVMQKDVLNCARDLIAADVKRGVLDFRFRIDVEDAEGAIAHTLLFKNAISVIPEG